MSKTEKHIEYWPNGKKKAEGTFKGKGVRLDGKYTDWYENGQKWHEGTYKDGEMIKETYWDEDGNKK